MPDLFLSTLATQYQPYIYSALWLLASLFVASVAALLLRLAWTGRFNDKVSPLVLAAFAIPIAVVAISIYFTHDIDLWQGLTTIVVVLGLLFGKPKRSPRRRGRRYRY